MHPPPERPPRRTPRPARHRALRAAPAVLWAAGIAGLSSTSAPPGAGWLDVPFADKVAHAVLFAGQALTLRLAGLPPRAAFLVAAAYGVVDEAHQRTTPGRTADPWDALADAVGAAVGAAVRRPATGTPDRTSAR